MGSITSIEGIVQALSDTSTASIGNVSGLSAAEISNLTASTTGYNMVVGSNGVNTFRVVSGGLDAVSGSEALAAEKMVTQAAVNEGAVTGTNIIKFPGTTTSSGTALKSGVLAAEVPAGMMVAGVLMGVGTGVKEAREHREFWEDLGDALFEDANVFGIRSPKSLADTVEVLLRMTEEGGVQAYCDIRNINNLLTTAYGLGAFEIEGVENQGITSTGYHDIQFGEVSPNVVYKAQLYNSQTTGNIINDTLIAQAYQYAISRIGVRECNFIRAECDGHNIFLHFGNVNPSNRYIKAYSNGVLYFEAPGEGIGWLHAQTNQDNSGFNFTTWYEGWGGTVHTIIVGRENGTFPDYYFNNVGATYTHVNPNVIQNTDPDVVTIPSEIPSGGVESLWLNELASWLANGFTQTMYNPYTNTNDDITYVPISIPTINQAWEIGDNPWNYWVGDFEPSADAQQKVWIGDVPINVPNIDPATQPSPAIEPQPWYIPAIENLPDADPTPKPSPYDNPWNDPEPPEDAEPTRTKPPKVVPTGNTPVPVFPTSAVDSANAMFVVHNPTLNEVNSLGGYLWTENIINLIAQFFQNPMDAIISLHLVYCTPTTSGRSNIKLGYLNSGVEADVVSSQYVSINCGTVNVPEYFGNATDYDNTRVEIYLPFIGFRQLKTSEIINSSINVKYTVDVYTGTCLAEIKVNKKNTNQVLYSFDGNCSVQVPLTSSDRSRLLSNVISAGVGIATENPFMLANAVTGSGGSIQINRSGNFSGNAGAMAIKKPYLIISRKISADADKYNEVYGYPVNEYVVLSNCSGFTRVKEGHIEIPDATDTEKNEIIRLLKEGVIL